MSPKKHDDSKKEIDDAIASVIEKLNEKFGEKSVVVLGKDKPIEVESWPSQSISIDYVLACGGVPRGRIIEVYGPSSSGKTTIALYLIAQVQRSGGRAAFIDVEQTFASSYAAQMGVDVSTLIFSQPKSGDEAMEIADALVKSKEVDLIIVDSVAALVPKSELDGEITDTVVGTQARMMSKAIRYLTGSLAKSKTTIVFINQIRDNIGVFGYGPKTTTPGGHALKFYSSVRLEVKTIEKIKEGNEVRGGLLQVTAIKNKVGMPFRSATMTLMFGKGIDQEAELVEWGKLKGVLECKGNTYWFGEKKVGVGEDKAAKALAEDPELAKEVEKAIRKAVFEVASPGKKE